MNQELLNRVPITGGSGFVGLHCVLRTLKEGFTVTVRLTVRDSARGEALKLALQANRGQLTRSGGGRFGEGRGLG